MSSYGAMNRQSEPSLEWSISRDAVDRQAVGDPLTGARLREAREASAWLYTLALLCLVSLLAFLYLALASSVASEVEMTATLEAAIQCAKEANNKLRLDIVLKEDLARVQQEAKAMGFVTPQHIEYLQVVMEEASAPLTVTVGSRYLLPATDTSCVPNWWDGLIRQFRNWITDISKTEVQQ